ncbi:16S rRNA (cytosine(1402)-N(4))-methyltransferase [Candidatus Poribacteria bacterium]|nr:16S rRNA (cytosine(1402)-N(4))-methyltransferase [Candidatus Poribacteria bacterium]
MNNEEPKRKRRVRYKGKYPRRFEEKYKELNPEKYADNIEKIIKKGITPAGTHRSICVKEILEILDPRPGQIGLDATLGYGGHAKELLMRITPGGCLFGIDVDPIEIVRTEARLRNLGFTEKELIVKHINFAGIPKILDSAGGGFDFILADLGVSSMQLDNPSRGFTYKSKGPLDLRLNPERGQRASSLIKSISEKALEKILWINADEPNAKVVAKAVHENRNEIRNGKVAILSFHSGEDNRVSRFFTEGFNTGIYSDICREPIRPSLQEQYDNPRSKSAILRWAVRAMALTLN